MSTVARGSEFMIESERIFLFTGMDLGDVDKDISNRTHDPGSPSAFINTSTLPFSSTSSTPPSLLERPTDCTPMIMTRSIRPSAGCLSNLATAAAACAGCLKVSRTITLSDTWLVTRSEEMIGPHRRKMACRASEKGWEMRKEKTYLDVGRGGALDEAVDLHDVAVGAGARPLDAYSTRGSGFPDCALD